MPDAEPSENPSEDNAFLLPTLRLSANPSGLKPLESQIGQTETIASQATHAVGSKSLITQSDGEILSKVASEYDDEIIELLTATGSVTDVTEVEHVEKT